MYLCLCDLLCLCIPCTSGRRWWCVTSVIVQYVHLYLCHLAIMFVPLLYVWEEIMVCSVIVCTCVTWLSCLCIPCTVHLGGNDGVWCVCMYLCHLAIMFVHPLYIWEETRVCSVIVQYLYMYLCHLALIFVPPLYVWEEMMVCSVIVCTCVTWLSCLCLPCTSGRRWWCVLCLHVLVSLGSLVCASLVCLGGDDGVYCVCMYLCHLAIMFVPPLYIWEEMMVCIVFACTCVTWLSCLCIPFTPGRRWWCVVCLHVLVSLGYPGRRWWCVVCLHVLVSHIKTLFTQNTMKHKKHIWKQ